MRQAANSDEVQEQLHFIEDSVSGLNGVIVLDSLALGPAAGGCRMWQYSNRKAMIDDARRLARGMTYKNALAGLPFGGGKAVLCRPVGAFDRPALFRAFGDAVAALKGCYITAEDVGTAMSDMQVIAERTRFVAGLSPRTGHAGGDPSPWTALGVFESMRAAAHFAAGHDLWHTRVAVQGLGNVGMALCELLAAAGVKLIVADIAPEKAALAAARFGASVVAIDAIAGADADIFAPCALGGVLDEKTIEGLRASIICGAANNQLANPAAATALMQRGITYAPDYVVNAGGIINVAAEYFGEGEDWVRVRIASIAERLTHILGASQREQRPSADIADAMARAVIAGAQARAA